MVRVERVGAPCFTGAREADPKGGYEVPEFPSKEWLDVYVERINGSAEYREAAATWEGDISYVFEAEPDKGVSEEIWAWLDLWHGECRGARYAVPPEEGEKAKFIIRAPYSRWKEVIKRELDPVKGMMQGKLKLKGDLPTIVRYVKAANELVNLAGSVPTEFVDEKS
jgi:putative sterol carrier protein